MDAPPVEEPLKPQARPPPFLKFRLTYLDTVQTSPLQLPPPPSEANDYSTPFIPARYRTPFTASGTRIDKVPEIRVFGATEQGQKCCVHIHGMLPYVYVEYEGKVAPDEVQSYINRLARAINVLVSSSLHRQDGSKSQFVAFIIPVKGVPFYGFHVGYRYYLKIYLLDPKFTTRIVTLLRSGEIMRKKFTVYEAHIPFLLQFMLDANLYGCGWVEVDRVKFREPVPEDEDVQPSAESGATVEEESESSGEAGKLPPAGQTEGAGPGHRPRKPRLLSRSTIPASMMYSDPAESPVRIAHSTLEFDIHVSWIRNRHLVSERNLHADFTEFLKQPIPEDFKFVHSVRELWLDEIRRRRMKGLEGPDFSKSENSAEILGGLTAGPRSALRGDGRKRGDDEQDEAGPARMYGIGTQPPWVAHNTHAADFEALLESDKAAWNALHPTKLIVDEDPNSGPDFETFVKKEKKGGYMEMIKTSFQSVESLFMSEMEKDERECNPFGAWGCRGMGERINEPEVTGDVTSMPEEEDEAEDVDPAYLAQLATQDGRSKLDMEEAEAAKTLFASKRDANAFGDANMADDGDSSMEASADEDDGDEENSDEEQGGGGGDKAMERKRQLEEKAKKAARVAQDRQRIKGQERAIEGERADQAPMLVERKSSSASEGQEEEDDALQADRDLLDALPEAGQPAYQAALYGTSVPNIDGNEDLRSSTSENSRRFLRPVGESNGSNGASLAQEQTASRSSSTIAPVSDYDDDLDTTITPHEENLLADDANIALLNELVPRDGEIVTDAGDDEVGPVFRQDLDSDEEAFLLQQKQKEQRRRAGFGDLSDLDLDFGPSSSPFAAMDGAAPASTPSSSSPAMYFSQSRGPFFSPKKRAHATAFAPSQPGQVPLSPSDNGGQPTGTPSPAKSDGTTSNISPALARPSQSRKVNHFSPAKSKLRYGRVQPAFISAEKNTKNAAEQLIGFRAIGDHGKTRLQQMLPAMGKKSDYRARELVKPAAKRQKTDEKATKKEVMVLGSPETSTEEEEEDNMAFRKAFLGREPSMELSDEEGDSTLRSLGSGHFQRESSEETERIVSPTSSPGMNGHGRIRRPVQQAVHRTDNSNGFAVAEHLRHGSPAPHAGNAYESSTDGEGAALELEDDAPAATEIVDAPTQVVYAPTQLVEASTQISDKQAAGVIATDAMEESVTRPLEESPEKAEADEAEKLAPQMDIEDDSGHRTEVEAQFADDAGLAPVYANPDRVEEHVQADSAMPETVLGGGVLESVEVTPRDQQEAIQLLDRQPSSSLEEAVDDGPTSTRQERPMLAQFTPSSSMYSGITRQRSSQAPEGTSAHGSGYYRFAAPAPSLYNLLADLDAHSLPHKIYQNAYFSNPVDVPGTAFEYAGRRYTHKSDALQFLPHFEQHCRIDEQSKANRPDLGKKPVFGIKKWEFERKAPSRAEVIRWCETGGQSEEKFGGFDYQKSVKLDVKGKARVMDTQWAAKSQIQGPTQANPYGIKYAQHKPSNAVQKEKEHMAVLAIELHINTRQDLLPDPTLDSIQGIFYCLHNEDDSIPDNGRREGTYVGFIAVQHQAEDSSISLKFSRLGFTRYRIDVVEDEIDLVKMLIDKVREWDPEVFTGYDVLKDSWGFLVERAHHIAPELEIITELSRVMSQSTGRRGNRDEDRWGYNKGATLRITGRHILPVWRLLKSDVNLTIYSLENVVFHVLRQRIPRFSHRSLTEWYISGRPHLLSRVIQYHILKVQLVIELLDEAEIVTRNAEFARVFGVDFNSVLTRGSQFKVESIMFKISKPENFMLPSPSRDDVGRQNAAECAPLILEPESGFYSSPVLVFDFQSLYPSVMIAYNLCYSTCLGRVQQFMGTNRLGTASLALGTGTLSLLKDSVTLSPNGLIFLKPQVRRSLISKMLTEILDTRVMVKKSMKLIDEDDKSLSRLLNARQLGLKFIANVTYGYTSATFSGRMPCVEIADAIVQTGRETLERAKNTIESRPEWGAIVRYGDTDSLFVHLPGKTKDEAFEIGNEIADTITRMNPKPVKLKFEKVYLPSFLLAKKRYVGFKYESQKDKEPEFDAKGIETVRRDGFPAMQKMLETCIKVLFRSSDLSAVKLYVQQQFSRILQHRVSPQDFIYAKEVKMGSYSEKGMPPPGAVVTARRMQVDPRTEALYGERVPYIISRGMDGPKAKQATRALTPEEFVSDRENALDAAHYIGRIVKALNRLFNLVGVDVEEWRRSTPRVLSIGRSEKGEAARVRVDQHFTSSSCPVCGGKKPLNTQTCNKCKADPVGTAHALESRASAIEERTQSIKAVCAACASLPVHEADMCDSVDCPVLYSRIKANRELDDATAVLRDVKLGERQQQTAYLIV